MNKFIKKTIYFIFGCIIFSYSLYKIVDLFFNYKIYTNDAIFIWGDSQAYQGLDLNILKNNINRPVLTKAHNGAGVYDFLVFTEEVPDNSDVILSISNLGQMRFKRRDYNRTGLSINALLELHRYGYKDKEILKILKTNLRPIKNIEETTKLNNNKDSINVESYVSRVEEYYKSNPKYLNSKQSLLLLGINKLISKNCNIVFIDFPNHPKFILMESKYKITKQLDDFKIKISDLFEDITFETITITDDKNIFHDATHLNKRGAESISLNLADEINNFRNTKYLIFKSLQE